MKVRYEDQGQNSLFESRLVQVKRILRDVSGGSVVRCGAPGALWTLVKWEYVNQGPDDLEYVDVWLEPFTDPHSLPLGVPVFELPIPGR